MYCVFVCFGYIKKKSRISVKIDKYHNGEYIMLVPFLVKKRYNRSNKMGKKYLIVRSF